MTTFVDTNVVVRLLTGEPPDMARRASEYMRQAEQLLLPDLIVAEVAYVLRSYYDFSRSEVAAALESVILRKEIVVTDAQLLLRALELYEQYRLDFADAYLIAIAERTGVGAIASFDRGLDRVGTVIREEPA